MILYTKYSNERSPKFRIRTDILKTEDGSRKIRKVAAGKEAAAHIDRIYRLYGLLEQDLKETGLTVNVCEKREDGVYFPYLTGETLEERLDTLLAQKKTEELITEIDRYFAMFSPNHSTLTARSRLSWPLIRFLYACVL